MKFYQLEESYCDCVGSWTNIIESFTDKDVADYWCEVFNQENECEYTDYLVSTIKPLQHTYDDLIEHPIKHDIEILERYKQWRRL